MKQIVATGFGLVGAAAVLLSGVIAPAGADEAADFYRDKTISVVVAAGAGGSYGAFVQLTATHLPKHMPGRPGAVPVYMTGAGGAKAANFIYGAAPKDGTTIGILLKYIVVEKLLRGDALRYEPAKFGWLGSAGPINSVVQIWASGPANTLDGARRTELIMGSTGRSSETYITPALMNALIGTRFKIVTGYKGMADSALAMEQGELHGRAASWDGLKSDKPDWLRDRKIVLLAQSGLEKNADLPDVPRLVDLARNAEDRGIFELFGSASTLGRLFVAPPGVPPARVAALRNGLAAMFADPAFRKDAEKFKLDVDPKTAAQTEAMVRKTLDTPPEVLARARQLLAQ